MNNLAKQVVKLYSGSVWRSLFVKIRFWDAPYVKIEKLVPKKGRVIDLGCGEGLFANYLALMSPHREVFGVDIDYRRIKYAYKGIPNTKFIQGDVTQMKIPKVDIILLVHLLHHLNSFREQEGLINECRNKLKPKGKLIIAEAEPKFSIKFFITWFTDHFLVPWLFERKIYSRIFFRSSKDWVKLFKKKGFSCKVISAEAGKPFTHIILECLRKS